MGNEACAQVCTPMVTFVIISNDSLNSLSKSSYVSPKYAEKYSNFGIAKQLIKRAYAQWEDKSARRLDINLKSA